MDNTGDDTAAVKTDDELLLYVQHGGFRKRDGANEYATLMHSLMACEVEMSFEGTDTRRVQRPTCVLYIKRNNT